MKTKSLTPANVDQFLAERACWLAALALASGQLWRARTFLEDAAFSLWTRGDRHAPVLDLDLHL